MKFIVEPTIVKGQSLIKFKDGFSHSFAVKTKVAHLWAAAPDLLKACKDLLYLLDIGNMEDEPDEPEQIKAKAAITKAEGKTQ